MIYADALALVSINATLWQCGLSWSICEQACVTLLAAVLLWSIIVDVIVLSNHALSVNYNRESSRSDSEMNKYLAMKPL